jgi:hypothetical protein
MNIKDLIHTAGIVAICFLLWKLITKPDPHSETKITYQYDTTIHQIKINVPQPVVTVQQPVPADVDTDAILAQYFQVHYYNDTIADSNLTAYIGDSIGYNRLLHRSFNYRITRPIEVHIQQTNPRQWGLSLGVQSWFDTTASFGLLVGIRNRDWEVIGGRNLTDRKYFIGVKREF